MATQEQITDETIERDEEGRELYGLSWRAVTLSLIFLVFSLVWMYKAGLVGHGAQLGESVPVVPAVGALLVLTLLLPLLRKLPVWLRVNRAGVLMVYAFLAIAVSMSSVGVARMLFPNATAIYYFATPENNFEAFQQYVPSWIQPGDDPEVIRQMYEGSDAMLAGEVGEGLLGQLSAVPWSAWISPLVAWTLFLLAAFIAMMSIMTMFRRQWVERERLTFPIVHLVMDLAGGKNVENVLSFFKNPVMWTGFALAAGYNLMNILNAWNPSIPAMGRAEDIGALFTERPWDAIRPLQIAWRPENFGLGYLVPTDITLSVWVFYLALRLANVFQVGIGYDISGFPFMQEQSFGSYLALGIFLVFVAREHLARVFRKAIGRARDVDDSDEPMSYRGAAIGLVVGVGFMLLWAGSAGMALWTAAIFFGLFLLFALVYARARAEAGAAMVWLFPFYQHKRMMVNITGSAIYERFGGWSNLTIFSMLMFLSRGYFQSMMAYQIEATKIADEARIKQRTMAVWLVVALLVGLAGAYVIHLQAYYTHGANILEGGTTQGGYRTRLAIQEYEGLTSFARGHKEPDRPRTIAAGTGFLITAGLIGLRSVFLRFPLHPLGFAMVTAYGGPLWGPFFIVWLIKTLVLRIGGMGMYRRLIPFFLGIVIGHFFTAGLVWGWLSAIYEEMGRRYVVHFG
ncbi:MAG: DUF6785 family protein [Armatimonadota bacterium]